MDCRAVQHKVPTQKKHYHFDPAIADISCILMRRQSEGQDETIREKCFQPLQLIKWFSETFCINTVKLSGAGKVLS